MSRIIKLLLITATIICLSACNNVIELGSFLGLGGSSTTSFPVKKDIVFTQQGVNIDLSVKDISNDPNPLSGYTVQVQYCSGLVLFVSGSYQCDGGGAFSSLSANGSSSTTEWRGTISSASQAGVVVTLTSSTGQVVKQSAVFSSNRFSSTYIHEPQNAVIDGVAYLYDADRFLWKSPDGEQWFLVSTSLPFSTLLTDAVSLAGRSGVLVAGGGDGVWRSIDGGFNWTWVSSSATPNTYVNGTRNPVSLVYTQDGSLYAFENENVPNVWKSTNDGTTWTPHVSYTNPSQYPSTVNGSVSGQVTAGFGSQGGVPVLALGNDLYFFGGFDGTDNFNDTWKISSGTNSFTNLNSRSSSNLWNGGVGGIWMARSAHSVVRFKNQWVLAGGSGYTTQWGAPPSYGVGVVPDIQVGVSSPTANVVNYDPSSGGSWVADESDVWVSSDGASWSRVASDTVNNPFGDGNQLLVLNDTLFSIKGYGTDEIWKSTDAVTWTEVTIPTTKTYSQLLFQ
jgi:hypothetical protein